MSRDLTSSSSRLACSVLCDAIPRFSLDDSESRVMSEIERSEPLPRYNSPEMSRS